MLKTFSGSAFVLTAALLAPVASQAADTANVTINATVTGTCRFNSGGALSLALDPALGTSVSSTATATPAFWCTKGTSYTISDNKGQNGGGTAYKLIGNDSVTGNTGELIPYSFSYTSTGTGTGKTSPITLSVTATVANSDFINATVGSYTDTVQLSITP